VPDEWIELGIAKQTAPCFENPQASRSLTKAVIRRCGLKTKTPERDVKANLMVEGIVQLLENNAGS
jgi:hypothetical protein